MYICMIISSTTTSYNNVQYRRTIKIQNQSRQQCTVRKREATNNRTTDNTNSTTTKNKLQDLDLFTQPISFPIPIIIMQATIHHRLKLECQSNAQQSPKTIIMQSFKCTTPMKNNYKKPLTLPTPTPQSLQIQLPRYLFKSQGYTCK